MVYLVTGGSGSGKSAFAENLAVKLKKQTLHGGLYYIATMHCYDEESKKRISRHREMRKDKCFETIERELFLEKNYARNPEKILTHLIYPEPIC